MAIWGAVIRTGFLSCGVGGGILGAKVDLGSRADFGIPERDQGKLIWEIMREVGASKAIV